jgi:hypothetical protein
VHTLVVDLERPDDVEDGEPGVEREGDLHDYDSFCETGKLNIVRAVSPDHSRVVTG